jgi:hypothetical protein
MPGGGFIDITLTGADGVALQRRRIQTWELRLTDMSEPLTVIGGDLLQSFGANFVSEGGEFAHGWAPLAPETALEKARLGYGAGILVRTGELMDSATVRGAPGNVFEVTPTSLTVGTRDWKAGFHQHGTSKMPARPIVGWSWGMRQLVVRRFEEWVKRIIAQS